METLSSQELSQIFGGNDNNCSWKNYGKSIAQGAIGSAIVGAGMESIAPGVGTGLGAASGLALGAIGGAASHIATCWW